MTSVSVSARKRRAFGHQLRLELAEILDNAVMHDRDVVGHMRMSVRLARLAVRGPTRMADAGVAHERLDLEQLLEIDELPLRPAPFEPAALERGHAGEVVAAIFEALQRIDHRLRDRPLTQNADNPAHRPYSLEPCVLLE